MADAVYSTEAVSSGGGRTGRIRTDDGFIDQDLKMPPALGGPGGATNPEQLFAAAYASCFHGALRKVAGAKKITVPEEATVTATIGLAPDDVSFVVSAVLTAHLPGLDKAQADELIEAAHQVCPYSKATRGNVDVQLVTTV
ncbi:organic hydroperoxide resistance protein [Pseudonocardia sp. HH130630-07]|uniref:organic hydroperoxide resistance protein n=1 Tax=Pseudonocardia sp. HH130630-07 TaxID=1690815 RepID=UPI0008151125|nr:organic hydroperoxide resistance protein [Pseudonocardia sp. HH130630-07]ANY07888.1 organic hydroperoxide resistance protein [Pseudonocardia sp. HH130630-07]